MTELFGRKYRLQIGLLEIEQLTVEFLIKTSLKREPNTMEIKVFNLSEKSRDLIESSTDRIQLDAGHESTGIGTLFIGDVSRATSKYEGASWVTSIEAGDGRDRVRSARSAASHAPGTGIGDILRGVVNDLGVGEGNLPDVLSGLNRSIPAQRTVNGSSARVLEEIVASEQLEWSIQRGNLQFLQRGRALAGEAIVLRPGTGLIGSPDRDKDGIVSCDANIMPDLFPGRAVRLESRKIVGDFRCARAEYKGNNRRGDWKTALKLEDING